MQIEMDIHAADMALIPLRNRVKEIRDTEDDFIRHGNVAAHDYYVAAHNAIVLAFRKAGNEAYGEQLLSSRDLPEFAGMYSGVK